MSSLLREIEAWLVSRVAALGGVPPDAISVDEAFIRYGLDSLGAARMLAELGLRLGQRLSPTLAWEHPTIRGLACHLAREEPVRAAAATRPQADPAQQEPLAIVGMSCRFPGAPTKDAFWQLLRDGRDAISEVPADRWNGDAYYDPTPGAPGKMNTRRAGFLDAIDRFDPLFFGISPREATYMDPQQRLMLELSWEALESAGIVPGALSGSRSGVFFGVIWSDYAALLHQGGAEAITQYTVTGRHYSIIANRVSYCLGLRGPSMAIDSACSSSIVALQAGCESLRRGESTLALVGAVNLIVDPESMVEVAQLGALSPDGRCYSFDARANGYVRGEGGGVIVLKRLSQALADGDSIYCVVRGYAVNNDGASNGLTAPNPAAQEALLRTAYEQAGIAAAAVQYVEAHGTGTPLGDPIEAKALGAVFAPGRPAAEPLRIGSAKTNIGHLEGAAGIVGIIKTALCIKHRQLVPSLNFATPNPHIPFSELRLQVQSALEPWPHMDRLLTAGVSSFGLGGTNGHAVLQEWQLPQTELLALSAPSARALADAALQLCTELAAQPCPTPLVQICQAAAARQGNDAYRLAVTASASDDLARRLHRFATPRSEPAAPAEPTGAAPPPKTVFVFGGQGAQWQGMGRSLWLKEPLFRQTLEDCSRYVKENLGWSLVDELITPGLESRLDRIDVSLPAIISVEIALCRLWRAWGLEPAAVIGHSTGEIAAAHVAGVLDLEDTLRTICAYGRVIAQQRGRGAMGVVGLSFEQTVEALKQYPGKVFPAIQHSIDSTVVAGEPGALGGLFEELSRRGIYCRSVDMDVAPHCPLVDDLREELQAALRDIRPRPAAIPIVSEVTGCLLAGEHFDAAHWVRNFGNQARFSDGIDHLLERDFTTFLEVSPHPLTLHAIEANLRHRGRTGTVLSSMRRKDERGAMLESLGRLFSLGAPVCWDAVYPAAFPQSARPVLPLLLSGRDATALGAAADRLAEHLEQNPHLTPHSLAWSLATTRSHLPTRAALCIPAGASGDSLTSSLRQVAQGRSVAGLIGPLARQPGLVAVLFPDQGAQRVRMDQELYAAFPVFRQTVDALCAQLDPLLPRPLKEVILAPDGSAAAALPDEDLYAPALFVAEVALYRQWEHFGLKPDLVFGHAAGAVAALHVAGVLSQPDACTLIAARASFMQELRRKAAGGAAEAVDAALCAYAEVAQGLAYQEPQLGLISAETGKRAESRELREGEYWKRQLREEIQLADGVTAAAALGARTCLECGPAALGSGIAADSLPLGKGQVYVASLRSGRGAAQALIEAAATLHTAGVELDFRAVLGGAGQRVELPTYPFQRQRFWLDTPARRAQDAASLGLEPPKHPLLGGATSRPDGSFLFTARLDLGAHSFLRDHAVLGQVLLPGSAFVELALAVGQHVGAPELDGVTLERPLLLAPGRALQLQIAVEAAQQDGRRSFVMHSRGVDVDADAPWSQHAFGTLRPAEPISAAAALPACWPPEGARPVELGDLYEKLRALGYHYGPSFRGLTHLYVVGETLYAEVALPPEISVANYQLHPALLDAALHTMAFAMAKDAVTMLPFEWHGVQVHAAGATQLRVQAQLRKESAGGWEARLDLYGRDGALLAVVERVRARPAAVEMLQAAAAEAGENLYVVRWLERPLPAKPRLTGAWAVVGVAEPSAWLTRQLMAAGAAVARYQTVQALAGAVAAGAAPPSQVVRVREQAPEGDPVAAAQQVTAGLLAELQVFLAEPLLADARFALLTQEAVAVEPEDDARGLWQAGLWGLLRSARAEHPRRGWMLLDIDESPASTAALLAALAVADEGEAALRAGVLRTPRLLRSSPALSPRVGAPLDPQGTILISGGTGGIGGELARHLVRCHKLKHLVLLSRLGPASPGAAELGAELTALGASLSTFACDVTEPQALQGVLEQLDPRHPLAAVFHCAATLDDGVLTALTAPRIAAVFAAKARGAWNLHQATRHSSLSAFVVFSSIAGILGSAGQANYAAANSFVDALCALRQAGGAPALSVAWGSWAQVGLAAHLPPPLLQRIREQGIVPLTPSEGVELLDRALGRSEALLVAAHLDPGALRKQEQSGELSPLLRSMAGPRVKRAATDGAQSRLLSRLRQLTASERERELLEAVRREVAVVLRLPDAALLRSEQPLRELGLDSLMAVEISNRLGALLELRLPATFLFDYPTAQALTQHLLRDRLRLSAEEPAVAAPVPAAEPSTHAEPIAIVAMACRAPGGVQTPEQLWELLAAGREAITPFPTDRGWDLDALYDPDPDAPGKTYVRHGGFLSGIDQFDAPFFAISPHEAMLLDPQQRLLLEVSWEVLERAGIPPLSLSGSRTGVFVGAWSSAYDAPLRQHLEALEGYVSTGNMLSTASGRISYTLGLQGPALTVDTACSSSLVGLHLAVQSLRNRECDLALAGGVTVMASPSPFIEMSRMRGLAADGRCKPFSQHADGVGWSEGCGLVALMRLGEAQRQGRPVLGVIRGSAVNQDGRSQGLTAPNGPAQKRLIEEALQAAGLEAAAVDAVEGHGTGTALGDPIEAQALMESYGRERSAQAPLYLGSLKSNLGHTQAAAGVLGVIKMVLALQHGLLPQTLHAHPPTAAVDWSAGHVQLLRQATRWPRSERPRRAGVSSFGISGTNAHLVLEEAPEPAEEAASGEVAAGSAPSVVPLLLSAYDASALRAQAARLAEHLKRHPEQELLDVAVTLSAHRSHLGERGAVVAATKEEAIAALAAMGQGQADERWVQATAHADAGVVFVFPGQGSQWPGMAQSLYQQVPVFAAALDEVAAALAPHTDWSLQEVLLAPQERQSQDLSRVDIVQPVLFAMAVALSRVWQWLGLQPAAVVGHSQGEIAAACVAGALTVAEGAQLVAVRSRLLRQHGKGGAMATAQLSLQQAQQRLERYGSKLCVAAVNGPSSIAVAGETAAVTAWLDELRAEGIFCRRIEVDYASHSAQVDAVLPALTAALPQLRPRPAQVLMVSTVDGGKVRGDELDAAYWSRNLRQPVRLDRALETLKAMGLRVYLELSGHPQLVAAVEQALSGDGGAVASLRRQHGSVAQLVRAAAELAVRGPAVDWPSLLGTQDRFVELPTYAFQRQRYWLALPPSQMPGAQPEEAEFWATVAAGDAAALGRLLRMEDDTARAAMVSLLPALSKWRQRNQEQKTLASWRYRIAWKPREVLAGGGLAGTWLVLTSGEPAADDLVGFALRALTQSGATPIREALTDDECDRGALSARLRRILATAGPLRGVLSLLALDEAPLGTQAGLPRGLALTLALIQALSDTAIRAPLWLLTGGAVSTEPGAPLLHPLQALTWGLGCVSALEHPEGWGGLIDVAGVVGEGDEQTRERLAAALAGLEQEDQLALRPCGMFVRRLVRAQLPQAAPARAFRPRGTVLVTGGTGGIGAHLCRWLARNGAEHLVLISRRGAAAPGAAELVAELRALGVRVTVAACDVADRAGLADLLSHLASAGPPLRAVIHAAGVASKARLSALTLSELAEQTAGKVAGALHLSQLLDHTPLDAFILLSSGAGVWGSSQQGAYAAANAFLDALAEQRRAQGQPACAVAWGLWRGEGLGDASDREALKRMGLSAMAPELASAALQQALEHDERNVIVADIDWARFAPAFAAARPRPLLDELAEARQAVAALPSPGHPSALSAALLHLTARERHSFLLQRVLTETAGVLGHPDASSLDPERGFAHLGLDSLLALELRQRLQRATGLRLPATLTFDHPSPHRVAAYLLEQALAASGEALAERPALAEPVASARRASDESIAIVGIGLRLPGGVVDLEGFWRLLEQGTDVVGPVPQHRGFSLDELYDPDLDAAGKTYVREAAFLSRIDLFDAAFFGISPREAMQLDPQHRLLLETAWQALENAGIVPAALRDSPTGVFVGIGQGDYGVRQPTPEAYTVTGQQASFAAGRLAFTLGLQGPALAVDTACSSSLVALHLACQALRQGECELALCGGASVMAAAESFVVLSRLRAVAPDGRCKTFSAQADGYGRGEGVVVLVLERLRDARARGHRILACIAGSAVNHDGASSGLTTPNGTAQQKVLQAALRDARLTPAEVDVVECHGTGTALGDPIEVQALAAVYGPGRAADRPLLLGAVKTQIGHLEAASGLGGVAKMLAALRHDALPPTLHTLPRNPHLDWDSLPVQVVAALQPWPRRQPGSPRRAGISAFGLSGTNAHVLLEEAPEEPADGPGAPRPQPEIWMPVLLSAKSEAALAAQAERLAGHLASHPEIPLGDLAGTLATTRSHFAERCVILAKDRAAVLSGLGAVATGSFPVQVMRGQKRTAGKLAFLFSGQGSQRPAMGLSLYGRFAQFREALDAVFGQLDLQLERPLRSVLFAAAGSPGADLLDQTGYTQPALFALEVALFQLLAGWGLKPELLLGHSIGELAAAHVAGVLTLPDACTLVAARARLMQSLTFAPGRAGAMVSLQAGEAEVRPLIAGREQQIDLAACNGPLATVISGDAAAVEELARHFQSRGRKTARLRVSHAFHSSHMDAMLHDFGEAAAKLRYHPPRIPIISNVTGKRATEAELCAPEYWVRQVRRTVRFEDGVHALAAEGVTAYLELGPTSVLCALAADCLPADGAAQPLLVPTLVRDQPEERGLLTALGRLHASGYELDWQEYFAPLRPRRIELPTYAFQPERFWPAAPERPAAPRSAPAGRYLLSGQRAELPDGTAVHTLEIGPGVQLYLQSHTAYDRLVVPGAFLLAVLLAVGEAHWPRRPIELRDVHFRQAIVFDHPSARALLRIQLAPQPERRAELSATLATELHGEWVTHVTATLRALTPDELPEIAALPPPALEPTPIAQSAFDALLRPLHIDWGAQWWWLRSATRLRERTLLGRLAAPQGVPLDDAPVPAGFIDNSFGLALWAEMERNGAGGARPLQDATPRLPFAVERLVWYGQDVAPCWAQNTLRNDVPQAADSAVYDLAYWGADGSPVALVTGLTTYRAPASRLFPDRHSRNLYTVAWTPLAAPASLGGGTWAILGAAGPALTAALQAAGAQAAHYETMAQMLDALAAGAPKPGRIVRAVGSDPADEPAQAAQRATAELVSELQRLTREDTLADSRYILLTEHAVATAAGEAVPGLGQAGLWGLLRSVRSEYPDRSFMLLDSDGSAASRAALPSTLAAYDEGEVALRQGVRRAPRLVRASAQPPASRLRLAPQGTVLVTGGTGGLGAAVARHLAREHAVQRLLLISRRGPDAAGAAELLAELAALGCTAAAVAGDVAERQVVQQLLCGIAPQHPLTAVFHCAGVVEDGILSALTPQRIRSVFAAKALGAWNLHVATRELPLSLFVVFSSAAGVLGSAGQANYAAANSFVDALCAHRQAQGLPGQSLAWGSWARVGLAAQLSAPLQARSRAHGSVPLEPDEGLALLELALLRHEALLVPMHLALETRTESGPQASASPLLRALPGARPATAEQKGAGSGLVQRLRDLPADQRAAEILELVRREAAAVLQLADATALRPEQPLRELGLDSLMAVETRNRLGALVGRRLPATLLFDYATPLALAKRLQSELFPKEEAADRPILAAVDKLEAMLASVSPSDALRTGITERLQAMLAKWLGPQAPEPDAGIAEQLQAATPEELFALIDQKLGVGQGKP